MTETQVQLAFEYMLKFLQFVVVVGQLLLLRCQRAALPPSIALPSAKPEPIKLLPAKSRSKSAKKPAAKKPAAKKKSRR